MPHDIAAVMPESDRRDAARPGTCRILFLVHVKPGLQDAFLEAYEQIRNVVASGVDGHILDQLCQSTDDRDSWLITSEWLSLKHFLAWERTRGHRDLVKPMRDCIDDRQSLRYVVRAETHHLAAVVRPATSPASGGSEPAPAVPASNGAHRTRRIRERRMERASVNGVELEYEVAGRGDPIVLIHGGLLSAENEPLIHEPALTEHHTVINYHRRGFSGSTHTERPTSIAEHAADCRALLETLGFERAHVVGHSLGGTIGVQLALDHPDAVRSLALLEPALMGAFARALGSTRPEVVAVQRNFVQSLEHVRELFEGGDRRGALEAFLESRAGEAFQGVLDYLKQSGEFEQAIVDADTFLLIEMPAGFEWTFDRAAAGRLHQPILSVLGAHSPPRAEKVHEFLSEWVPQTELAVLPDAEHALPLMDPAGIAEVLRGFFARQVGVGV